jgi:hypothetical protein
MSWSSEETEQYIVKGGLADELLLFRDGGNRRLQNSWRKDISNIGELALLLTQFYGRRRRALWRRGMATNVFVTFVV